MLRRKDETMASFLQQLLAGNTSFGDRARVPSQQPQVDDDTALGWECANPALQFEGWEPAPLAPAPVAEH